MVSDKKYKVENETESGTKNRKKRNKKKRDLNLLIDQGPLQCLLKCTRFVYYSY